MSSGHFSQDGDRFPFAGTCDYGNRWCSMFANKSVNF